ncbi:uncharacterized protein C8Q71DRAFT_516033 [Rhodofomes roseus]|uniref:F-box domain-containing protein n=1 Tax=Rhodofomes roseus TaxID=34475 RepID=A0ABQ8KMH5_9APHY|nr:uncharacterized protein C8Q71DRAFT_516033 [Rhodofomes roseus]KAH9839523.1 hypothetical protein C8Q71DRAFT_516033 [Rhodofomes roseus]
MSSATEPLVFSNLPAELLRDVFEHAAALDPATARTLSLVSSAVRHWTEPLLYETVVLSSSRSLRSFLAAVSSKPAGFVRTRVKHLGIFALGPVQSIDRVLNACEGVDSLACGFNLPGYKQVQGCGALQALQGSREQHLLGLSCRDGWDTTVVAPSVTHLRIHVTSFNSGDTSSLAIAPGMGNPTESGWERLTSLSSLTHLAIVYRHSPCTPPNEVFPTLQRLLTLHETAPEGTNPPRLELVLVQVIGGLVASSAANEAVEALSAAVMKAGGPSLRIVAECAPTSVVRQWETAARGGPSIWEGAEEVVKERLASAAAAAAAKKK